ncbi:MAG: putative RND superfamily exporter protein [Candidatus Azotimanducaceae bacterium]|jgi:predicted RND superfamily exporter protein
MIAKLFRLSVQHQPITLLILTLVTLILGGGLTRLSIDTSFDSLIPQDDHNRLVYQQVMDEFGSDNKTIIYIEDEELWTPSKLATLESIHSALKRIPGINRVEGLFSSRTIKGTRLDGKSTIKTESIITNLPETALEAQAAKLRALSNPLYIGNLFSEGGDVTAIIVTLEDELESTHADIGKKAYETIETLLGEHKSHFSRLFQVGPPRVNAELRRSLTEDFQLLGPLSAFVLVVSILIFMRSALAAAVPIVTSTLTIIWTFGILGWSGIPLNLLSAMIPSLIIVIGSTEDTHMMAAFFRGLSTAERNDDNGDGTNTRQTALAYMAKHTGLPLLLTVLTTTLGFASNLFTSIGLIQDFAIASTLAILINGIITVLVVPLLLSRFGQKDAKGKDGNEEIYENNLPSKIIRTFRISQDKYPIYTLGLTAILCIFFTIQASKLYVTNDPMSYFPQDNPLIQDTQLIHQELAGIKVFFVTLEAETENAFLEPENLRKLESIQAFMEKQGVFDSTLSMADHLKYVNGEFQGRFGERSLPKTREMVAQYLLFFHRTDLESYVSHDYRFANIIVRHNVNDSNTLNQYIEELESVVQKIAGIRIKTHVIGENLMINRAAESLMISQIKALGLLLLLIFVIMSIMFTSLKGGAIALIPSLIPIVLMFGLMGFLDIPLNPATAMVAVIAVGIAIDGTIHLLARYNEICRSTSDYKLAVKMSVQEVATPLIVSSLALSFGFGILLFSNFTVVAQFGALAAATMLISIFANLLITPIIMERVRLVGLYQIIAMNVDEDVLDHSPLFKGMTRYQRKKAILISELHEFQPNEKLVEQDTIGRSMFMILEGQAEVIRNDEGQSRIIASLTPGEVFGEIGYIRAVERTADVIATTAVSALRFDYERMQKDLKFFPNIVAQLNFNISAILGERLADALDEKHQPITDTD